MKKIYVIIAVAAIALCAASCGNKKAKEAAQEPAAVEAEAEAAPADSAAVAEAPLQ